MADKRAFAKFDVGYLDNPKMMEVLDASGNAVLMHVASVLYSAQHLTDGFVAPRTMQRKAGATADDAQILVEQGLWHEPGHTCGSCPQPPAGKVYVHDFLEHNRSSDEAKDKSSAGKKAALARWGKKPESDADGNAERIASGNAEREREKESVPASRRKPERPLPADWLPNESHKAYANENSISLDFQADRFRNHAQANDRRARDWDAAFRNWLLKAEKTTTTKNALWDS